VASSLVVVETTGDKKIDVPLDRLGGQGVFVKEVQLAVLARSADAAVHSAKDLPASADNLLSGLVLGAFPERADPRDVLVGGGLSSLPTGSMVATGSARRRAQLGNLRPDLAFTGLRGNLATRLRAVGTGGVAAVVVAKAALDRLGWSPGDGTPVEVLDPEVMIPQVGQGALAVECRAEDEVTRQALAGIDDRAIRALVTAERAFLSELGGGCTLPVGAHASFVAPDPESVAADVSAPIALTGMLASGDGRVVLRHRSLGDQPEDLGRAVARYLLEDGGGNQFVEWERPSLAAAIDEPQVEG